MPPHAPLCLRVRWCWHACVRAAPTDLTPLTKRIADRIMDSQPACVVLVLDNK